MPHTTRTPTGRRYEIESKIKVLNGGGNLWRDTRVGLLGGSFNPAHEGHLHISLHALKRLKLDHVWWLVSPQNPLKPATGMAPLAERLSSAQNMARHPRIMASDIEQDLGTRFTIDTLTSLKSRLPETKLVWLMGADNMVDFPRWRDWQDIARIVPVAIFDRPGYSLSALTGKFAKRFADKRLQSPAAGILADHSPPAWVFVPCPRNPVSATRIRRGAGLADRAGPQ